MKMYLEEERRRNQRNIYITFTADCNSPNDRVYFNVLHITAEFVETMNSVPIASDENKKVEKPTHDLSISAGR